VPQIVYASTGKALRPYSCDNYASSKQAAEWLFAEAAARNSHVSYSAARFTHVVDGSIVITNVGKAIAGETFRLHDTDDDFYAQSALESAQLLLVSSLNAQSGRFNACALNNLGMPINLTRLVIGAMAAHGVAPVYISGKPGGYELKPWYFLYDQLNAGDVSGLISALEWPVRPAIGGRDPRTGVEQVDCFSIEYASREAFDSMLSMLEAACRDNEPPDLLRKKEQLLSWARFEARLETVPGDIINRTVERIRQATAQGLTFNTEHGTINELILAAAEVRARRTLGMVATG